MGDSPSIHLGCPKSKTQIGTQKQELLNKLSDYDYMTFYRQASRKQHSQTAGWLTESTKIVN